MTIDEPQLRLLLGRLEGPPEPPSTVNLAQALAAGRRKLRRRTIARAGTFLLAVCTAAAIAVPASGWLTHPARPPVGPVTGQVPRSFNPLRPYAFFARLPAGARELTLTSTAAGVGREVAESSGARLQLVVLSARACQLAGPLRYLYRARPGGPLQTGLAPQSIRCPSRPPFAGISPTALIARAPAIGQANAYWITNFSNTQRDALAWQYAPTGWAFVSTAVSTSPDAQTYYLSRSMKTRLHILATGVRFGGTAPVRFPFRLTRVPAHWGIYQASTEHMQAGQLTKLALGPADGRSADLTVNWYLPLRRLNPRQSCGSYSAGARPVHLGGGVTGYLKIQPAGRRETQELCVPDVRRQAILLISLTLARRASAGATHTFRFTNAAAVFKHLRFPQAGTTHPLG
jgi:hypothetical protein